MKLVSHLKKVGLKLCFFVYFCQKRADTCSRKCSFFTIVHVKKIFNTYFSILNSRAVEYFVRGYLKQTQLITIHWYFFI